MTRAEQIAAVDLAKKEILRLRRSNAQMLATLKDFVAPGTLVTAATIESARALIAKVEGRS